MFLLWLQAEAPDLSSGNQTQDNRQVIFTNEPSLQSRLQYIFGQQERMNGPDYFIISLSCDFMGSWLRGILTGSLKLLNPFPQNRLRKLLANSMCSSGWGQLPPVLAYVSICTSEHLMLSTPSTQAHFHPREVPDCWTTWPLAYENVETPKKHQPTEHTLAAESNVQALRCNQINRLCILTNVFFGRHFSVQTLLLSNVRRFYGLIQELGTARG